MVPIDRRKVRRSFHEHAREYDCHARVQKRVVERLAAELAAAGGDPRRVLDIGAGTGRLLREMVRIFPGSILVGADLAFGMAAAARDGLAGVGRAALVTADAEKLPFADGVFDLAVSTSTFQWLEDLSSAFGEVRRVLTPGGGFRFAFFGERTLFELRTSYREAFGELGLGRENRTLSFPSAEKVVAELERQGYREILVRSELEIEVYPDVVALLRAVRGVGAGTTVPPAGRGLAERRVMLAMMNIYRRRYGRPDGVPATYEVLYGAAVKPDGSR